MKCGRKVTARNVGPEEYAKRVQDLYGALYCTPGSGRNIEATLALPAAIENHLAPLFADGPLTWEQLQPYLAAQATLAQRSYREFEPPMGQHYSRELEWINHNVGPIATELTGRPFPGSDLTIIVPSAREQVAQNYDDIQLEMATRQKPVDLTEGIDLARQVGSLAAGHQMTLDEPILWTPDSAPARSACFIYALPCMSGRAQIANTVAHEWRHFVQGQIAREGPGGYNSIALLHTRHKPLVEGDATEFSRAVLNEAALRGALESTDVSRELRDEAQFHGRWRARNPRLAQEWSTQNNYATGLTQL